MLLFPLPHPSLAVVPILIGPLQVLLAILPGILVAIGGVLLAFFKPASIRLMTLLMAALVASLCYSIPKVTRAFSHRHVAAYTGEASWPMFRGGPSRRGSGADSVADPTSGGKVWAYTPRFKAYYASSPALIGNCILAAASDPGDGTNHGAIFCLNAGNGAVLWNFAPPDFRALSSSPVYAGRYVVCGEGLHMTNTARIVCLAFENGRKLWEVRTSGNVESAPCLADGMAFCGAGADGVYGLKLDTPSGSSPVVWHLTGRGPFKYHCDAAVAASHGRVYFSSAAVHGQDWNGVVCVDAATGKELWHADAPMPVWGPPTLVGDRLVVGMGNGTLAESATQAWERRQQEMSQSGWKQEAIDAAAPNFIPGGALWALEAQSGRTLWTRKLRQTLCGAVAAADGRLYFASRDGLCMCVTLDNELVAQWDAHEGIESSPAVGSNHMYVVTESGRLCGLDRHQLHLIWQAHLGKGELFTSSPVVGNGHVYVGTPENGLLCLGNPSDQLSEAVYWPGARGGAGRSGCIDGSSLPAKGAFAWRWPVDHSGGFRAVPPVITSAAVLNGTLYASLCSAGRTGLVALTVGDSTTKPPTTDKWFVATAYPPGAMVAATTSRVYFAEGQAGQPMRQLRCVDANTGSEVWRTPIEGRASGAFTLAASSLYFCGRPDELLCMATRGIQAGQVRWSARVGHALGLPCLTGDRVLVATTDNGVVAVTSRGGKLCWQQPTPRPPLTGPIANADVAVFATVDSLVGLSLVNGARLWTLPCRPSAVPLVADETRILCTQTNGEIVVVTWNGKVAFSIKSAMPGLAGLLFGERILYCNQQGTLQTIALSELHPESRWLATAWLGTITTAPVMAEGGVYFTTAEKGLICARQGKE